jgi:prolyl oligopeptidase
MRIYTRLATGVAVALAGSIALAQPFQYPVTRKVDQVDVYHGTRVADPYRWLEDDMSPQTAAWVEAQNKITFPYLEAIPYRAQLHARVKQVSDYAKYSSPSRKGPYYFFSKNEGLQDQNVLYIQKGLNGTPEVLIDPNKWPGGGTTRLSAFAPSANAKYAVYGISKSGSDWQQYKVMELATKRTLPDTLYWV